MHYMNGSYKECINWSFKQSKSHQLTNYVYYKTLEVHTQHTILAAIVQVTRTDGWNLQKENTAMYNLEFVGTNVSTYILLSHFNFY